MLNLDVMRDIRLHSRPIGHRVVGSLVLFPNYAFPLRPTAIEIEGWDNVPHGVPVIFAMNHTDRYNYFPLQYKMWRSGYPFTATWVKGKYYNHPLTRWFMTSTNNIPVPSRGYLITADAASVLGHPPSEKTYRVLRHAIDNGRTNVTRLREDAAKCGADGEVGLLLDTPRDMLGLDFRPHRENYVQAILRLFATMMDIFVDLNQQAFDLGLNIIVFPEGTRSRRLSHGHTGLAQMAIRMKATVVPVGCNGSDKAYSGNTPISQGGRIVYRMGKALRPDHELKEFQLSDAYRPYTLEAVEKHGVVFEDMTRLVMSRINELLDPEYQSAQSDGRYVDGYRRFM